MLVIRNQSISEIFQELSELSIETKELGVLIEQLPSEIDTDISLAHFIFSLRSYPRKLVWFTDNQRVFEIFYRNKIAIYKFHSAVNKNDLITQELDRQAGEVPSDVDLGKDYHAPTALVLDTRSNNPILRDFNSITPIQAPADNFTKLDAAPAVTSTITKQGTSEVLAKPQLSETFEQHYQANPNRQFGFEISDLAAQVHVQLPPLPPLETIESEVFNTPKDDYSNSLNLDLPHVINSDFETDVPNTKLIADDFGMPTSDFDFSKLRHKILASKEVLQSINRVSSPRSGYYQLVSNQLDHIESLQSDISDQTKLTSGGQLRSRFSALRYVYFLSFALVCVLLSVGIILGFPTVAYTVEIQPERKESQGVFEFERAALRKQNYKFDLSAKTETTGTVSVQSTRAKGKIRLLNRSGNEINVNSSELYLEKDGRRYNIVLDSTQSRNITIPAKNHLSGPVVELTVESGDAIGGTEANQIEGTEMIPRNLRNNPIGPNFRAVVSESILGNPNSGKKTVAESDVRTLRSTVESNLSQEKQLKVEALQASKEYISNVTWSVNVESEFSTDSKAGDVADNIAMTSKISADIYYISVKDLSDKILATELKSERVLKTVINNSDKAWSLEPQRLSLDTKYITRLKSEVTTERLKQIAEDNGLDTASTNSQIRQTYNDVANVKQQVSGITVPGISPRIEIEVVQRNISNL